MDQDDAYALLLTYKTRLEQEQDDKSVFNTNYTYSNEYYPKAFYGQPRESFRRRQHIGGRNMFFGKGSKNHPQRMPTGNFRN